MGGPRLQPLSRTENLALTAIAYFQSITRGELSQRFGKEISRDVVGQLRALNFIAAPASPTRTLTPNTSNESSLVGCAANPITAEWWQFVKPETV
jgi:chromosome segregation and condensation protein ScpB